MDIIKQLSHESNYNTKLFNPKKLQQNEFISNLKKRLAFFK